MRRLELDYRASRRTRFAAYGLAVLSIAFAAELGVRYRTLKDDVEAKLARLARVASARPEAQQAKASPASADEHAFARQTVRRLTTPWEQLFEALEGAANERIALLAIEPDAESRTVSLSGEAKDYLATLTYVANLSEQAALTRVHLARHELRPNASARPVAFTVSASWRNGR